MKRVVGITAWRRTLDTDYGPDRLQTLSTYYSDSVIAAGMLPLIVPNGQSPSDAAHIASIVDGVIVSGGDDVDPANYGEEVTASRDHDPAVDEFEVALVEEARAQGKPLLAICRGLQLLNVALGGSLSQEVTEPGGVHEPFDDGTTPEDWEVRRHVVRFEEGSILAGMYDAEEAKVNTLHHQGVATLAIGLVVEGRTDDGLIEAARCDGSWWALGVQWHPERMEDEHQGIFGLFREAVEAASSSTLSRVAPPPPDPRDSRGGSGSIGTMGRRVARGQLLPTRRPESR